MLLLCDRPHEKNVDFDTARFVVGKSCGINVGGQRLERGDLVPEGVLKASSLREMYDTPSALIEVIEHGMKDESLLAAMLERGTLERVPEESKPVGQDSNGGAIPAQEEATNETSGKPFVPQESTSWAQVFLTKPESGKIDPKAEVERLRRENEILRQKKAGKGKR